MIKFNNNKISVYKGAYKPVDLQKNAKNLGGYFIGGTNENEAVFDGTYDDYLTLYGKSDYLISPNLCPNLKPQSGAINEYSWQIIPNSDGTFNFSGAMVTGETVGRVTLPAGTYTASGCKYLQLYWDGIDGFLTLPSTFTLSKETTVLLVFWYTETVEISLTNQYIQIEKGEQATEFCPYSGGLKNLPAPDNFKFIASSMADIKTYGKNIFNFTPGTTVPGEMIEELPLGAVVKGVETEDKQHNAYANGWYTFIKKVDSYLNLKKGDAVTISMDYTVLETAEGKTGKERIGIYLYAVSGQGNLTGTVALTSDVGEVNHPSISYTVKEDGNYYLIITLNSNKVKIENIQIEYGNKATEYYPYFGISEVSLPKLHGIEVEQNCPKANYTEVVEGGEKYYISDCYKANKYIRNIGLLTLNGSEQNWTKAEDDSIADISIFSIPCNDAKVTKNALCSHFNYVEDALKQPVIGNFSNNIDSQNNLVFVVPKEVASTTNEWINWLSAQNDAATPVTVYYVLNQPITTVQYISTGVSYKPKLVKTFGRRTYFKQTPSKNCFGYGAQKSIKICQ